MDLLRTGQNEPTLDGQRIRGGEQRSDKRYTIALNVRWKLIRRQRLVDSGSGTTVDLSSGGLLFETDRELPVGLNVELSIAWPVLLNQIAPLQLIVAGRVVRTTGQRTAVRMKSHEFRTAGRPEERRGVLGVVAMGSSTSVGYTNGPSDMKRL